MIVAYQIALAVTAFGALVILGNILFKKSGTHSRFDVVYGMVAFSLIIWAVGRFFVLTATEFGQALFWVRILYTGSILVHVLFLHTILVFLNLENKYKTLLFAFYFNAFILVSINGIDFFTGSRYFIQTVIPKLQFAYYEVPGTFYNLHLINYLFIPIFTLLIMLRALRDTSGEKAQQIKLIVFSSILGFFGGNSVVPLVYGISFEPYLLLLVPFHLGTLAYAISQHHLFNMKVIATEILTALIWIFILIETVLSETNQDLLINGILLVFVIVFGIFLIRSVSKEVQLREKLEELSKALGEANEELKKLDQAKSEFISIASHQLRAPLTVIKGYTSMILEGSMGHIADSVRDALQKTYISAEQLIKLVASLLDLSRIESGKIRYEFKPTNFVEIIQKVLGEFKHNADAKKVVLIFENKAEGIPLLSLDADKMREVVINFIDNAIKYTAEGTQVAVMLEKRRAGWVRFSVRDQGIGIKKEDIKKLFIKFNRTDEARARDPNGMGIGLYFVKRVTEDHGGKVGVESEGSGKGSTFFAALPIK